MVRITIIICSVICLNVYLDWRPYLSQRVTSSLHKIRNLFYHFSTIHACIFKMLFDLLNILFIQKLLGMLEDTYLVELYHLFLSRDLFLFRISLWFHIQSILHALDFFATAQLFQLACAHIFNYLIEPLGSNRSIDCLV